MALCLHRTALVVASLASLACTKSKPEAQDEPAQDELTKPRAARLPSREPQPLVPPAAQLEIVQLVVGDDRGCVRTSGGHVYCWGRGDRLGVSTQPYRLELPPVRDISLDGNYLLAVTTQGEPWDEYEGKIEALGEQPYTQLVQARLDPCALDEVGHVTCVTDTTEYAPPALPNALVEALIVGPDAVCALMKDATVRCNGKVPGLPDQWRHATDFRPLRWTEVVDFGLGQRHGCVLLRSGEVRCFGDNDMGELGDGTTVPPRGEPDADVAPVGLPPISAIAVNRITAALARDGRVFTWGPTRAQWKAAIDDHSLTVEHPSTPRVVEGIADAEAVGAGEYFGCALARGEVRCWGDDQYGQLGNGDAGTSEVAVPIVWPPSPTGLRGRLPTGPESWSPGPGGWICLARNGDMIRSYPPEPCAPILDDGSFEIPLQPGSYAPCPLVPSDGRGLDCELCRYTVRAGEVTTIPAKDALPLPLDTGFVGVVGGSHGEPGYLNVPHAANICAGPVDAPVLSPTAQLRCATSDHCGRYALPVPPGEYRLFYAEPDADTTVNREPCRFRVAEHQRVEVERIFVAFQDVESCPEGAVPDPLDERERAMHDAADP